MKKKIEYFINCKVYYKDMSWGVPVEKGYNGGFITEAESATKAFQNIQKKLEKIPGVTTITLLNIKKI